MKYDEIMEEIKRSTEEHKKNAIITKNKKPKIPVLKENLLIFRNIDNISIFLNVNKQKYKYVGFCYSKSHYQDYLHFANSIKEFYSLNSHRTTIYCIVKLDKSLDRNYYIEVVKKTMQQLKIENSHDVACLTDKNNNIYEKNYNSFKQFLIKEKVNEFEKQKNDVIKVAENEIELL